MPLQKMVSDTVYYTLAENGKLNFALQKFFSRIISLQKLVSYTVPLRKVVNSSEVLFLKEMISCTLLRPCRNWSATLCPVPLQKMVRYAVYCTLAETGQLCVLYPCRKRQAPLCPCYNNLHSAMPLLKAATVLDYALVEVGQLYCTLAESSKLSGVLYR